ncbi:hypothetical protein BDZ91DRAFT_734604 [Kalaharituber pfeilii]|nr:hypothetical protein BDZ91DRAFT_734604 [Kalaharituber pfeilii]
MHKYQQLTTYTVTLARTAIDSNHSLRNVCSVPCRYDRTQSTHHAKHCLHSVAECPTKFPPGGEAILRILLHWVQVAKNKSLIYVLVTKPLVAYCCAWFENSTEQIQQCGTECSEFQS